MLRSGYNCFLRHRAFDSRKGPKKAGIVRVKTWESGLFFRQRSAWRVVTLLCGLLLAGFGFSRVKTRNRCFFKLLRKHFLFTEFYGILRKTFNIGRSRNAQGRFWIRQRDDPSRGVILVYCVADFYRWEWEAVAHDVRRYRGLMRGRFWGPDSLRKRV